MAWWFGFSRGTMVRARSTPVCSLLCIVALDGRVLRTVLWSCWRIDPKRTETRCVRSVNYNVSNLKL